MSEWVKYQGKNTFKKFAMKGILWSKDNQGTNRDILLNYVLIHWNTEGQENNGSPIYKILLEYTKI